MKTKLRKTNNPYADQLDWRPKHWNGVWEPESGDAVEWSLHEDMRSVFCTVVCVYRDYAIVDIPEGDHHWFDKPAGEYIVPERLLYPQ